jgi:hypothetical protein
MLKPLQQKTKSLLGIRLLQLERKIISLQIQLCNLKHLVSKNHVEPPPTPIQLNQDAAAPTDEVDPHKSLFYEQLQLYYSTNNQRKLTGQHQLNSIIEVVKGDVPFTKGDVKQATLHYKYKKDFAVLSLGDHCSPVRSKDVVGKATIDISTVPRYVCYEELYNAIRQ